MAKRYSKEELVELEKKLRYLLYGQGFSTLIVDPSLAQRRTIVNGLRAAGVEEIEEARDGAEGWDKLRKLEGTPVLVLELNAPKLAGADFTAKARGDENYKEAKIILMSAENDKRKVVAGLKAGADAFLKRPFEPEVLVAKIREFGFKF